MIGVIRSLFSPWTWRMAARETRARRRRLALFGASMVVGIAALIAVGSFRDSVLSSLDEQAKSLLGADLVIAGRARFGAEEEALFGKIGGRQATETDFSSMVLFPGPGATRLVQVRALEGEFPFYGELKAEPAGSVARWRSEGGALVEETLLAQVGAKVGDALRVGGLETKVAGALRMVPGDSMAFAALAPRIYLRSRDIAAANLLREGSLARYKRYFQLPQGVTAGPLIKSIQSDMDRLRLGHTTVEKRKEDLGNSLENLADFLSLAGFVALFLGGVGVGSAMHTHVRDKLRNVALLRCLGATEAQTFAIYLAQAIGLGVAASVAGAVLGLGIQWTLPSVLGDFLRLEPDLRVGVSSVLEGGFLGLAFCLLFALLPLMAIRRTSPLLALRVSGGSGDGGRGLWMEGVIVAILVGLTFGFAWRHTDRWTQAATFTAGFFGAFLLLAASSRALMWLVRRLTPAFLPYPWRQGLSNLHRPNNRTALLVLSLGLGTFVLTTLHLSQNVLLSQIVKEEDSGRPNTVLFDIQPDQREGVSAILREQGLKLVDEAPIVTLRLASLKGRAVEDLLKAKDRSVARWALRREYRCTWREQPSETEKITAGSWHPAYVAGKDPIPVSVEEGIAKDLGLGLGDPLEFDLQGFPLTARVASLRKVEWRRVQPNFFVIFPPGALEGAPAFHVFVTRTESASASAALQRVVVQRFPNVSTIDLTLILNTINAVLDKVSMAIRFMALFTVATGLLVLGGAVLVSRHQRMRESALLRTLGASRAQVRAVLLGEYLSVGLLAALVGVGLSVAASWGLAVFVFKSPFVVTGWGIVVPMVLVPGVTLLVGALTSRGVTGSPPLEVLREESL